MFGIGGFELFLILLFGFLIFGPDKLPAMAKTIGKAIAKFRNAQEEMSGVLKGEMVFDKDAEDPFKNPLDALDEAAAKAKKGADSAKKAASAVSKKASVNHQEEHVDRCRRRRCRSGRQGRAGRRGARPIRPMPLRPSPRASPSARPATTRSAPSARPPRRRS